MTRAEELKIIRLAATGDHDAATALIQAHQRSLFGYLLRLCGRPDVAEDVVQEAFVRAISNIDRFDPRFRFSTWLFTIARRVYLNASVRSKPAYDSELVGRHEGTAADPTRGVEDGESLDHARDALQRALLGLSLVQREVVILFHQQDWPIWLVAQHLELPEGTVKSHLHRGRRRLRELLEAQAVTDPSAKVLIEQFAASENSVSVGDPT